MHIVTGLSKELLPPASGAESGGQWEGGAGLVPGVFSCAWEWMVGAITVLWMEAQKEPMAERWRRRKEGMGKTICCLPLSFSDLQEDTAD